MNQIYYLDSSAWVKRYSQEAGTEMVESLFEQRAVVAGTPLGFVKVTAALARRSMPTVQQAFNLALLKDDWSMMAQSPIVEMNWGRAAELAQQYILRGTVSIHLFSVLRMHEETFQKGV
jgi:predicted nucleic acid-binding protein